MYQSLLNEWLEEDPIKSTGKRPLSVHDWLVNFAAWLDTRVPTTDAPGTGHICPISEEYEVVTEHYCSACGQVFEDDRADISAPRG